MLLSVGYDNILNKVLGEHTTSIFTATLKMKVVCFSKTHLPNTTWHIEVEAKNVYFHKYEHLKT